MRKSRHHRVGGGRRSRRSLLPWVLWGLGILAVAGGVVAADRRWLAASRVDPTDPAVRVAGAVRSISGTDSVRRADYDPVTKVARVDATSRYYDASRSVRENREYLATEGRLAAQLALHEHAAVSEVQISLYARRTRLATVTARQGQAFADMKVEYSGPLASP